MNLNVTFDSDGYVHNFAVLGAIDGGEDVVVEDDLAEAELDDKLPCYRKMEGSDVLQLDVDRYQARMAAAQAQANNAKYIPDAQTSIRIFMRAFLKSSTSAMSLTDDVQLQISGSPMYALWSGNNNLTSQLTLSGLGANPGYNTFIFIFAEGYAGYRIPIAIPFSIIPSSKSLIFEVGSGSTGAFSRFYVWKNASNLYLQQYGYIGSGGSLRTVYGRY